MNKLTTLFLALLLSCSLSAQQLYVGTYNIRYNNPNDEKEGNAWAQRCPQLCDFINFEQPEIFGTQEVLVDQLHDLMKGLDGYGYIGVGRDDGKEKGEYAAIIYKKDQLSLLDSGNFWLSPTPEKACLDGMQRVFAFAHGENFKIKYQVSNFISSIRTWTMWVLWHGERVPD